MSVVFFIKPETDLLLQYTIKGEISKVKQTKIVDRMG